MSLKFNKIFKIPLWLEKLIYGRTDCIYEYRIKEGPWKRVKRWTNMINISNKNGVQFRILHKVDNQCHLLN